MQRPLSFLPVLLVLAAHALLGLTMKEVPVLARVHSLGVLALGLAFALWGKDPLKVACVGAYIVGSEVLWRMTGEAILWEYGKYALTALFLAGLARRRHAGFFPLLLAYFVFLLPSAMIPLLERDFAFSRRALSFNLSGPFALVVSVFFLSTLRLTNPQVVRLLLALVSPIMGVAAICFDSTFVAEGIEFGGSSNAAASGGFGPNQVSATLGMGILAGFLAAMLGKTNWRLKTLFSLMMLFFAVQAALTLSRTGIYLAGLTLLLASSYLIREPRVRLQLLFIVAAIAGLVYFVVYPFLDEFTGGALSAKYRAVEGSNREEIFLTDLKLWADHPLLGVGVGLSPDARAIYYKRAGSHTEFSRLLCEHGSLGLVSGLLLFLLAARRFQLVRTPHGRALTVSMLAFAFLFMLVSAMRLALPSFAFGLGFVTVVGPSSSAGPLQRATTRNASRGVPSNPRYVRHRRNHF
jgi:hypothetical protein